MTTETFPTSCGPIRAQWDQGELQKLSLEPEADVDSTEPTPFARRVQAHLRGQKEDFRDIPLSLARLTPFAQKVYRTAQEIPPGQVRTYGELAEALGSPGSTRAVGTALGKNPFLLVVPCHRIVGAGKNQGGFSAPGGLTTKRRFLALEGHGVESLWDEGLLDEGFRHLLRDAHLGPIVEAVGPCPLQPLYPNEPFAALARNVLYQQLAGSAAKAIENRVRELGQAPFPLPAELLALPEERLRQAGLSGPKIAALRALSQAVLEQTLRVNELRWLPDDLVVEEVSKIKGLGSWSAEMFLLFHLGRRDLLPVKDLGIRKGFQRLFGSKELPTPVQMERWSRPWRPYRSLACWYLWRSLEL